MGPFSFTSRSNVGPRAVLLGALILPISVACEEKRQEPTPTEPWLKDEAERQEVETPIRPRFQVTPESSLSIALPERRSKPTGKLKGISGHVDLNIKDLAQTSGAIHFSLSSLEMDNLPAPDKAKSDAAVEAPELYTDATGEAHRWLGLGAGVPDKLRKENAVAVFQFNSLRSLSHSSVLAGAVRQGPSGGSTRLVTATAEGELALRGFSVSRTFPTSLKFHFPDSGTDLPDSIEVTIGTGVVIPLAEYEIKPRGPDGNLDTMKSSLLGSLVGKDVHVTGTLLLRRETQVIESAKTPEIPD